MDDYSFIQQSPPPNVDEQSRLIVEAGIARRLLPDFASLPGIRYWGFVRILAYANSALYVMADIPSNRVPRLAVPLAVNTIATPVDDLRGALEFGDLLLIQRLALGDEDFDLQPELRLRWKGARDQRDNLVPPGTVLEISRVTFGYVEFRELSCTVMPRTAVTHRHFSAV